MLLISMIIGKYFLKRNFSNSIASCRIPVGDDNVTPAKDRSKRNFCYFFISPIYRGIEGASEVRLGPQSLQIREHAFAQAELRRGRARIHRPPVVYYHRKAIST